MTMNALSFNIKSNQMLNNRKMINIQKIVFNGKMENASNAKIKLI